MPLNFFVWTNNAVALTSVVSGVFDKNGNCEGFAAANVKFSSMSNYLTTLVDSARYDNLNIALIETGSSKILGTSLGPAIYKENQTNPEGTVVEQELAASLGQMENNSLAHAMNNFIEESYGSIDQIPTPLITSATLDGQEYFISFDSFTRPMLNLTILVFIPHVSITGPIETQRDDAIFIYEESADEMAETMQFRLIVVILIGVFGLLIASGVAALAAGYLSRRIQELVKYMENLRSQIKNLNKDRDAKSTATLCETLPPDFFPEFGTTRLKDINKIHDATRDLCDQLQDTWNTKQDVFRQALEQRQFTASIAHDIRNPLHGVLGIVSMMQSSLEENRDKLPLLADTLNDMSILLNDMVDLSKIQGGKVTHVSKKFEAWDILQEIRILYEGPIVSAGGSLSCEKSCELPPAFSDPVHVKRIMTNFVSNASKYASSCQIALKATVANREEVESLEFINQLDCDFSTDTPHWAENANMKQGQYIVLACHDKGRGIPPEKLDKVFEAYQQTQASDRCRGAGLGLAIVKGLAVEMGGGIGVLSQVGNGSLFWLVIKCKNKKSITNSKSKTENPAMHALSAWSTSSYTSSTQASSNECCPAGLESNKNNVSHVLVVDDTKLNLTLLQHFLTKLGITSDTADNAIEGLRILREDPEKFSLIISDFHMPKMTGGEMCLEVRKDERLCHLPFILSSGNLLSKDEKNQYSIDDALMKPFTIERLKEVIVPYIHRPSKWAPVPVPTLTVAGVRESNTIDNSSDACASTMQDEEEC